jgi:hypothetical protein
MSVNRNQFSLPRQDRNLSVRVSQDLGKGEVFGRRANGSAMPEYCLPVACQLTAGFHTLRRGYQGRWDPERDPDHVPVRQEAEKILVPGMDSADPEFLDLGARVAGRLVR